MLMTTKFRADMKRIIEKMEALADETAAVDYALARRLRELARRRRVALDRAEAGEYYIPGDEGWMVVRSEGGGR